MTSLIFHDLPPGPMPLFLGEPRERIVEVGHLVCDHVGRTVRFIQADPYENFAIPAHSRQRYATYEVDAAMPRRQLYELYSEVKPLLERLQAGTTVTRTETAWIRTRTPDANVADAVINEVLEEAPAAAPVEWASMLRVPMYAHKLSPAASYLELLRRAKMHHGVEINDPDPKGPRVTVSGAARSSSYVMPKAVSDYVRSQFTPTFESLIGPSEVETSYFLRNKAPIVRNVSVSRHISKRISVVSIDKSMSAQYPSVFKPL